MSTVRTNNVQVGQSVTATNNFTLYQPTVPDGTVRLGVGNTGATTADVITATSAGNVGIGTSSPNTNKRLHIQNGSSGAANYAVPGMAIESSTNVDLQMMGSTTGQLGITFSDSGNNQAGFIYYQNNGDYMQFATNGVEQVRVTSAGLLQFNSGYGSFATAYGCRAWVNFNGTGTVAIRASGNVSSITDSGTGAYTVNFTNALVDANYAGVIMTGTYQALASNDAAAPTTTAFAFISRQSNSPATSLDSPYLHVAIFR